MKANINFSVVWAVLGLSIFSCSPPQAPEVRVSPQAVRAATVRIGPMAEGRTYLSDVVAEQTVKVIARVPGTVTSIAIAEGAPASYGDALARVSAPDVAARMARVRSERKRVERERDFACNTLETDRVLAKSGDLPSITLQRSERGCASANLAVEGAKAGEREASVAKSRSTERAPFDGEVLMHLVDEGQSVMPGSPILQFASRERLLRIRVPASDLEGIVIGGEVTSKVGSGTILSIGASAMGPGRVIELLIKMDKDVQLRIGTTLDVMLVTKKQEGASAVPVGAIGGDDGAHYLMLIENGRLRRFDVEPGVIENGWTAITPALPKGTEIVAGAVSGLDPAVAIMVVKP